MPIPHPLISIKGLFYGSSLLTQITPLLLNYQFSDSRGTNWDDHKGPILQLMLYPNLGFILKKSPGIK